MQRPLMDPTFLSDAKASATTKPRVRLWRRVLRPVGRGLRATGRVLFYNPWTRRPAFMLGHDDRRGPLFHRFCKQLLYRLVFAPIALACAVALLVYTGTHPRQTPSELDPSSQGIYYDPVTFLSEDGVRLDGWLVPVLEPKAIILQKEKALKQRFPAVVLVHDFSTQRHQMLPLIRPLHDSGIVVLVVSLRGTGTSGNAGVTFGLREALDVKAAVQTLRNRVYVDPTRIAVLGAGSGATAAIVAASNDPQITALVLDHPLMGAQQIMADYIGPSTPKLRWMQPLTKWTFEMTYNVDVDDLEWSRLSRVTKARPTLMFDDPLPTARFTEKSSINGIRDFLKTNLKTTTATASAR